MEIGTADIDFRQRIEQPPQPRASVEDGERQLSHTAVYAKFGSMDPNWSSSKDQSQCSCSTRISTPLDSKCLMYGCCCANLCNSKWQSGWSLDAERRGDGERRSLDGE